MINNYDEIQNLEQAINTNRDILDMIYDAAAMYLSKYPEREEEIQRRYQPRIELFEKKIEDQAIY